MKGKSKKQCWHIQPESTSKVAEEYLEEKGHSLKEITGNGSEEAKAFEGGHGPITPEIAQWISKNVPELTENFINAYDYEYMKYIKQLLVKASRRTPPYHGKSKKKTIGNGKHD